LPVEAFTPVQLNKEKSKTVWVATVAIELISLKEPEQLLSSSMPPPFKKLVSLTIFLPMLTIQLPHLSG
jgi:hypothetical protein